MLARQASLPNTKWPRRRWCKTQPHPEAKREGRIRSSLVINTLGPSASTAHGEGKHGRVNQPPPASLPLHAALKKRGHQAAVVSILFHFLFSKKVNPTPLQGTPGGNTHGPCPEGLPGSPWFTYIFVTHACVHTCQGSNPGNGVAGLLPSYYSLLTSKDRSGRPHSSVPRETITSQLCGFQNPTVQGDRRSLGSAPGRGDVPPHQTCRSTERLWLPHPSPRPNTRRT